MLDDQKLKANEKLKGLNEQMSEMKKDFEEMKTSKIESRKELEGKFQDIYKKLDFLQQFLGTVTKQVNDSLRTHETKFNDLLNKLKDKLQKEMEEEKTFVKKKFEEYEKHLNDLEKKLEKKNEERFKQNQDSIRKIQERLDKLEKGAKQEKKEREDGRNEIIKNINDHVSNLNSKLNKEKEDRNNTIEIFNQNIMKELGIRDKSISDLEDKNTDDLKKLKDELYTEMENRFDHQNRIIENITCFLKAFQETLSIMGKDI